MARILITQRLVPGALDVLDASDHEIDARDLPGPIPRSELLDRCRQAHAIVCLLSDVIDESVLAAAPGLEVIANVAVGYDNIDLGAAAERGIRVVNTPGVLDESTADIAMALMLGARRRTSDAEATLRQGHWSGFSIDEGLGLDLSAATLGLVGFGRIARRVAERAAGFDMEVLHHTRHATGAPGWIPSLTELARASDVLSIHVPLTAETRGLISAEVIAEMAPTSVIVNTSRGAVLDEGALVDALEAGRLWGAGLDVYAVEPLVDRRVLEAPHTVLLPHVGSATVGTRREMCALAIEGALEVLAGREPWNLVNPR
jgi:glyoxylate reductase